MKGQINLGTPAGDKIKEIASMESVNSIVEIGTWNGQGSTLCILEGLKSNPDCSFWTIECNGRRFNEAKHMASWFTNQFSPDQPRATLSFIWGRIIEEEELDRANLSNTEKGWLAEDVREMEHAPNTLASLPNKIDFLVLDGGEFSTRQEFLKLWERSRFIFLDDTRCRKNKDNREQLLKSTRFVCLEDNSSRNGWAIFERM